MLPRSKRSCQSVGGDGFGAQCRPQLHQGRSHRHCCRVAAAPSVPGSPAVGHLLLLSSRPWFPCIRTKCRLGQIAGWMRSGSCWYIATSIGKCRETLRQLDCLLFTVIDEEPRSSVLSRDRLHHQHVYLVIPAVSNLPQMCANGHRRKLQEAQPRVAYYPGSAERAASFRGRFSDCEQLGSSGNGVLPWLFAAGLSPSEVQLTAAWRCPLSVAVLDLTCLYSWSIDRSLYVLCICRVSST